MICWTPDGLHKLANLTEGLKLAKEGLDFPEAVAVGVN